MRGERTTHAEVLECSMGSPEPPFPSQPWAALWAIGPCPAIPGATRPASMFPRRGPIRATELCYKRPWECERIPPPHQGPLKTDGDRISRGGWGTHSPQTSSRSAPPPTFCYRTLDGENELCIPQRVHPHPQDTGQQQLPLAERAGHAASVSPTPS